MIDGKKILAVIPARGGSKGVPYKNIREISGKPLIAWVIEAAKKSSYIDRLVLSSDDDMIIKKAIEWGCEVPFKRPHELALDESRTTDAVLHAIDNISGYDIIVVLQPTSPLVEANDIDCCIKKMIGTNAKSCVSMTEPDKSPYWMFKANEDTGMVTPLMDGSFFNRRRQDLPVVLIPNGAVYVAFIDWLRLNKSFYGQETTFHVMPRDRSVDIDTEMDFIIIEALLKKMQK